MPFSLELRSTGAAGAYTVERTPQRVDHLRRVVALEDEAVALARDADRSPRTVSARPPVARTTGTVP